MGRLSVAEKILLAAFQLFKSGHEVFTAEELVVESWKLFPDAFGLQGFADQFPDSNRVLIRIMDKKSKRGLVARGWLEALGDKRYRLSAKGIEVASQVQEIGSHSNRGALQRYQLDILKRLLTSSAFEKDTSNRRDAIIFRDACKFWGITVRSRWEVVERQLEAVQEALSAAEQTTSASSKEAIGFRHGQDDIRYEDVKRLRELDSYLRTRFKDDLLAVQKHDMLR